MRLYRQDSSGKKVDTTMHDLIARKMGGKAVRTDLFVSQTRDGELLLTPQQDGTIRMLVAEGGGRLDSATEP